MSPWDMPGHNLVPFSSLCHDPSYTRRTLSPQTLHVAQRRHRPLGTPVVADRGIKKILLEWRLAHSSWSFC